MLTKTNPNLATRLNPFNTSAKINAVQKALVKKSIVSKDLKNLARQSVEIILLSPQDARGYSLLGEIHLKQGRRAEADKLFAIALSKAPTEINALLHSLERDMREKDFKQAVNHLDVLLRRWPQYSKQVKDVFPALARTPNSWSFLLAVLKKNPPWRSYAIRHLLSDPLGRARLQRLVLEERSIGKTLDLQTVRAVISAYLRLDDVATAYRTFALTLQKRERKVLTYVFDSNFSLSAGNRSFMWQVGKSGDVDVDLPYLGGQKNVKGLIVRFRDVPTRLGNITQMLAIPAGSYRFEVIATARALVTPKGLYWELLCRGASGKISQLARITIPEGVYDKKSYTTRVKVPEDGCLSQILKLKTGLVTATWQARYQGDILFHRVAVTRF